MTKDKQIEEMAKDMCEYYYEGTCYQDKKPCDCKCEIFTDAQYLYSKGYRKASDVAEEIFAEIDALKRYILLNENIALKCKRENGEYDEEYWKGKLSAFRQIRAYIDAELKKKYTEDGE